jgi:hypothetical protein
MFTLLDHRKLEPAWHVLIDSYRFFETLITWERRAQVDDDCIPRTSDIS